MLLTRQKVRIHFPEGLHPQTKAERDRLWPEMQDFAVFQPTLGAVVEKARTKAPPDRHTTIESIQAVGASNNCTRRRERRSEAELDALGAQGIERTVIAGREREWFVDYLVELRIEDPEAEELTPAERSAREAEAVRRVGRLD